MRDDFASVITKPHLKLSGGISLFSSTEKLFRLCLNLPGRQPPQNICEFHKSGVSEMD
jgi:hypothetical protein